MRRMALVLALAAGTSPALAQVSRFELTEDAPAFAGRQFGEAGAYRRITARATIALDPTDPHNAVITDISAAPRNADGKVEATADVVILTPANPASASGTMLVDVPNRGRKLAPELFDDSPQPGATRAEQAGDAGNGFLYGRGTTLVWIGWQGDISSAPGQLAMQAPVLSGVTGRVREEFVFDNTTSPAVASPAWKLAASPALDVSVRDAWADPRQKPAGLSARVADDTQVEITRPAAGFDAGALYELVYTARDPVVLGMGFAMTRDVASFLRRENGRTNPLTAQGRSPIARAILFGVSQSGRFTRDYLYLGFNQDAADRIVFEGMMPHVGGARRMATNVRFGQPGRNARHPQDPAWQADEFPFTYAVLDDPLSGRRDGLLLRCQLSNTCPLVMQTDSEHEWWASRASLLVTDTRGTPIDLPPNVRAYMLTGTTHFETPGGASRQIAAAALPTNPLHNGPTMRALFVDMEQWIGEGRLPPSSRVPMRSQGTLVPAAEALPGPIPGLPYAGIHTLAAFSDQTVLPPREIGRYPVFVPRLDNDGIAVAGVHQLSVLVPRATFTGWNPRSEGYGPTALYPLQGTMLPFATTEAERRAKGDPRRSIAERYGDDAGYARALQEGAALLQSDRLLLKQDAPNQR